MGSTSQEKSLSVKSAFERWADRFGVKIKIYHADNGRFSKQALRSKIEDANQTITFCGVGSHHQNTIVERKIQTLTLGASTLLPHTKIYLPEEIIEILWLYALMALAEQLNVLKVSDDGNNPMEKFPGKAIHITPKNQHTWGCLVYVLDAILQ